MAYPSQDADRINFRVPDGLRERLKEAGRENGRSMNAEIVARLESSFEPSQSIHPELARLVDQHIEHELTVRLRKIAASIGGGEQA